MSTVFASITTPGPPGPPGRTPLWLTGAGVPSPGIGTDGDMYLNSVNSDVYGPKASGAWGAVVANIKGTAGATGPTGAAGYSPLYIVAAGAPTTGIGNNGDMYLNSTTSDLYGPKAAGVWGAIVANIKGSTGATGPQGPAGIGVTDPTTAKGDLIVRQSPTVLTKIGVGADGQVLTADAAQTIGVKWATPAAGGGSQTPWTQNIEGGGFTLKNAGRIGVGLDPATSVRLCVVNSVIGAPVLGSVSGCFGVLGDTGNWGLYFGALSSGTSWIQAQRTDANTTAYPLAINPQGGNIGIGIAVPASLLDVHTASISATTDVLTLSAQTTTAVSLEQRIKFTSNAGIYNLGYIGVGFDPTSGVSGYMAFGTGPNGPATEKMRISAVGNVGIAIANPGFLLSLGGAVTARKLAVYDAGGDFFGFGVSGGQFRYDSGSGADHVFYTSSGANERMRITAGGCVGIGIVPAGDARLEVRSFGAIAERVTAVSNNNVQFRFAGSSTSGDLWAIGTDIVAGNGGTDLTFYGFSPAGPKMVLLQSGNCGIGVTNPLVTLHVGRDDYRQLYLTGSSNPTGIQLRLGGDASNNTGVVEAIGSGAGTTLLFNPSGGVVAVGTLSPQGTAFSIAPKVNASSVATAKIFTIGESTNTSGYYMGFGMFHDGVNWNGSIQTLQGGGGALLILNGIGGNVGVAKLSPQYQLDIGGDCNISGTYRVNGTPISTGGSGGVTVQTAGMANSSRFISNTYQNTFSGGKPVLVTVTCNCNAAGSFWANCNSTNSFGAGNQVAQTTSQNASQVLSISFWVLPNYFFAVSSSGSVSLTFWTEWY